MNSRTVVVIGLVSFEDSERVSLINVRDRRDKVTEDAYKVCRLPHYTGSGIADAFFV